MFQEALLEPITEADTSMDPMEAIRFYESALQAVPFIESPPPAPTPAPTPEPTPPPTPTPKMEETAP